MIVVIARIVVVGIVVVGTVVEATGGARTLEGQKLTETRFG